METNYIALAIPFFFLLIALELGAARRQGRDYYRLSDSVNDLRTGVLQQLASLLFAGFLVAGYLVVSENSAEVVRDEPGALTRHGRRTGASLPAAHDTRSHPETRAVTARSVDCRSLDGSVPHGNARRTPGALA